MSYIWKKGKVQAVPGDLLVASVAPGNPSYFWPGRHEPRFYYRTAKAAYNDTGKEEDIYRLGSRFNYTTAFFAVLAVSAIFYLINKK